MPPAISDNEESASENEIPFKKTHATNDAEDEEMQEVNGDDAGEEGDEEQDEYVVEKILSHAFDQDGTVKYEIKWLGYEKKADRTWEPEENLEGAKDILEAYHKKIGGRPVMPDKSASKKRKSLASASAGGTPNESKTGGGRGRKKTKTVDESGSATPDMSSGRNKGMLEKWQPPKGSWEEDVEKVDTVEELPNPKTSEKERYAYIVWISGRKTQHPLKVVNQKCPQKMLAYYEQHLVFKNNDTDATESAPVKRER